MYECPRARAAGGRTDGGTVAAKTQGLAGRQQRAAAAA
eukprot:COSAG06_NODE_58002_length_278_cov_0.865922_1_plen_37_part_01